MSLNNGFRHSRNIAIVPVLLLIFHFMYECKILYIYMMPVCENMSKILY